VLEASLPWWATGLIVLGAITFFCTVLGCCLYKLYESEIHEAMMN